MNCKTQTYDALMSFMKSDAIVMNPNYWIEFRTFGYLYAKHFIKLNNKMPVLPEPEILLDVLQMCNLKLEVQTRVPTVGASAKNAGFIIGCTFASIEIHHPNYRIANAPGPLAPDHPSPPTFGIL